MHCISPNFLITEKGLKSLQGHVNGVVFQEVHFCSKEKKIFTSETVFIRQPGMKIHNLTKPLSIQQKKKRDYSTSAWSRY